MNRVYVISSRDSLEFEALDKSALLVILNYCVQNDLSFTNGSPYMGQLQVDGQLCHAQELREILAAQGKTLQVIVEALQPV